MRNLTIFGAVVVLAVLVATVAVFGSGLAQADLEDDDLAPIVANGATGGAGFADNKLVITWSNPTVLATDGFSVVITICKPDSGRCKSGKVTTFELEANGCMLAGDVIDEAGGCFANTMTGFSYPVVLIKGHKSIHDDDLVTVCIRVKHGPMLDDNSEHDTVCSEEEEIDEGS